MARTHSKKYKPAGAQPQKPCEIKPHHQEAEVVRLVWSLAEPICMVEGMELVHVEYQREPGGRVLRLYIDKPGGVSLEDCSVVSRQLGDVLDLKLETGAPYTLEVSSPGINRPLSRLSDFEKFTGKRVKIKIAGPINGRKHFTGILSGTIASDIQLKTETMTIAIPYGDVLKARLVHDEEETPC